MPYDLLIRNATVVLEDATRELDVAVEDGKIAELAGEIRGSTKQEIDGADGILLPGLIDVHVHFNEPGRTDWEGFASGSTALAAGGGTCFFEMPLNSSPPTINAEAFDLKRAAGEASSVTDFALWGGIVPGNLSDLDHLAERGVIGFKAFMSNSGMEDFPAADDWTLYQGMKTAAKHGLPVAVHAESDSLTAGASRQSQAAGRLSFSDYLDSRPVLAELEAIQRAILLAADAGCSLHIVHVSHPLGVEMVAKAREQGTRVTCETCPHYLVLDREAALQIGAAAKCAPPLRDRSAVEGLWEALLDGRIDLVASDHSPSPEDFKMGSDFFKIWGGIAGCQSTLPLLFEQRQQGRKLDLRKISELTAATPARRFGLKNKGRIALGYDADLTMVRPDAAQPLARQDLLYAHAVSPYLGRMIHGMIRHTWVRGQPVLAGGQPTAHRPGKCLRPEFD